MGLTDLKIRINSIRTTLMIRTKTIHIVNLKFWFYRLKTKTASWFWGVLLFITSKLQIWIGTRGLRKNKRFRLTNLSDEEFRKFIEDGKEGLETYYYFKKGDSDNA